MAGSAFQQHCQGCALVLVRQSSHAGAFDAEAIKNLVPMKRAGKPEEVADLVAFLASDKAAYISGQVISINGAMI